MSNPVHPVTARIARPYLNATTGGILLGFVLLAAFVTAGRGLGASGAFASTAGAVLDRVAPSMTAGSASLAYRMPSGVRLADEWIVWEVLGMCIGAAFSAWQAGRWGRAAASPVGASTTDVPVWRPGRAIAGGLLMGVGARLAYGCTSGLALSGGALMATGAWTFIAVAFPTAFLVSFAMRLAARSARGDVA